jgi:type I restriction enzyme S subunit
MLSGKMYRFRVDERFLDPRYVEAYLNSQSASLAIDAIKTGISDSGLNLTHDRFRQLPFPLAPVAEQRRIVAAIEEQFSRLDVVDQILDASIRRIELLRKQVLISWVPQLPSEGWKMATVGGVGTIQLGRQRSPKYHRGPHMRPYLRVANVFEDRIDVSDVMEMNFSPDEFERYRLCEGDVLLNEGQTPELVGRPAIYRGDPPEVAFTNSLLRFVPGSEVDAAYALLVFRRHLHAGRFKREARITTNIAHLSAGRLKTVEFPYPSVEEQRRVVSEVDGQLSRVGALHGAVQSARRRSSALRRAILERAFRGELVPQDPDGEPALVLLERIRAERAAARKPNRRKRVPA